MPERQFGPQNIYHPTKGEILRYHYLPQLKEATGRWIPRLNKNILTEAALGTATLTPTLLGAAAIFEAHSPGNVLAQEEGELTEEEQVLNFPGPNATAEERRKWFDLVDKLGDKSGVDLDISGCIPSSIVFRVKQGDTFIVKNSDESDHTIRHRLFNASKTTIKANSEQTLVSNDIGDDLGNYGYACDDSARTVGIIQIVPSTPTLEPTAVPEPTVTTPVPDLANTEVARQATGIAFTFDALVSSNNQRAIRDAISLGERYFTDNGIGALKNARVEAYGSYESLIRAYSAWGQIPESVARGHWQQGQGTAVAGPGIVFLSPSSQAWEQMSGVERTRMVIHELFHVHQFELSGKGIDVPDDRVPSIGPRWLIEGSADYVTAILLETNRMDTTGNFRKSRIDQVKRTNASLQSTETWAGMMATGDNAYSGYSLGFVATELIVSRSGVASLGVFWREIGQGANWEGAFQKAFGRSVSTFYSEFEQYRRTRL